MSSSNNRDVDSVTASMTAEELSNLIVSFRKPVKYAKIAIAKTLAKKVKVYQTKKKSSEKQENEDKKRSAALQKQIDVLKKTKVDKITRFCLGLKSSFEETAKKGVPEDIALSRVANQKLIKKKVAEWREKHSDWELLSAFINTQISRRHKNRTSAIIKNERILRQREKLTEDQKNSKKPPEDSEPDDDSVSNVVKTSDSSLAIRSKTDENKIKENKDSDSSDVEESESDEDSEDEESEISDSSSFSDDAVDDEKMEVDIAKDKATACKEDPPKMKKPDNFFLDSPFLEDDDYDNSGKSSFSATGQRKRQLNSKGAQNFGKNNKTEKNESFQKNTQRSNKNTKFDQTTIGSKFVNKTSNKYDNSERFSKKDIKRKDFGGQEKEESLHPSWAAKKKEKERLFINFQCKRIEFDD